MKLLVIEACIINHRDDKGGIGYEPGAIVDAPKDEALTLATAGRVLYINKEDDPTKERQRYTASADLVEAAQAAAKAAKAAAAKAAAAQVAADKAPV